MSKPILTIITTPASAPATEPPTPAFEGDSVSADRGERSPVPLQSPSECSDQIVKTAGPESPATEEVVGTPGIIQDANNRLALGSQEEAGKVKAWTSTISTSESVPVGLRLPPIPDEATLRDLSEARSRSRSGSRSPTAGPGTRFGMGKAEATRSMPSLKDTAKQQPKPDQTTRGRSPLAQANTSGPSASPNSSSRKQPSGFKAFMMKAFGLGKSSTEKQKQKDRTPVASPSSQTRIRQSPVSGTRSPAISKSANPAPFVKVSVTKSPPTLATPVFASASPVAGESASAAREIQGGGLAPPRSPADVPLPPSPYIPQGSPDMVSSAFTSPSRLEETVSNRPPLESRNTDRSERTALVTPDPNSLGIDSSLPAGSAGGMTAEIGTDNGDRHSREAMTPQQAQMSSLDADHSDDEEDQGLVIAKSTARASPGRAGIKSGSGKIMSAIEPQQAPPFATSPVDTSHINAGSNASASKAAELHGGVTMSRSVTAEGMKEAEEIMGEKQLFLREASEKLAAIAATNSRRSMDPEEEEAKDSFVSDLGFKPRTTDRARKVSPTPPKYGRSASAPGGDRIPNASASGSAGHDGFGRKASVNAGSGVGLTRSGSKLRTSVYGLADILHKKETTPQQKRISASPTMHTMGTIMREANEIMDQDERDRAESFFMS